MLPKEYFEDSLAQGVAFGTLQHVVHNRFTLLKLDVGYGKTVISMLVAKALAALQGGTLQIMVIAPKAKRLDKSFNEAIESTEKYYGVKLNIVPINGQEIGTFAGLNTMKKKPDMWKAFQQQLFKTPTLLILDETHMQLRNPTGLANKTFVKLFKEIKKHNSSLKILGLTATPFDTSILDTVGYLVLNGDYTSRTAYYRQEVSGYTQAYQKGLHQRDIENMIVDGEYKIHKDMFNDIHRVLNKLKQIIYAPEAPRTFHIPENTFKTLQVNLSSNGTQELRRIERLESMGAYSDNGTKTTDYVTALTTDINILDTVVSLVENPKNSQPLIFYQLNVTRQALIDRFTELGIDFYEVNGHSQSYFKENDGKSPVIVQYLSGAAAFESKTSNTSIYLDLPTSAINFQQSLGRNARRGQDVDVVTNYIIEPLKDNGRQVQWFKKSYNRIVNKTRWNQKFEKTFITPWGQFDENKV